MSKSILITGVSGFIGYYLCYKLIRENYNVIGIDNLNEYYDVNLKISRLKLLGINKNKFKYNNKYISHNYDNFTFYKIDLADNKNLTILFKKHKFEIVVNLAAQAGVRYSLINPKSYIDSNIMGFFNLIDLSKQFKIDHFVYASSSSVYGLNKKTPFSTSDKVDKPANIYAATKKSNELIAHSYSNMFNLRTTGLRFFTVYGPWGRPDMALFLFTDSIFNNKSIDVYNNGNMLRDFTYIDDIINSVFLVIEQELNNLKKIPYSIYNIGRSEPSNLLDFIIEIEKKINKKANKRFLPIQIGDVKETYAEMSNFKTKFSYKPSISIKEGISNFIDWYIKYYKK
tara:strand:+ start:315 stop:1337 length:1023 start_codon:yes stop_codon:yes gene_type:complete